MGCEKGLYKEKSFELGFELVQSAEILQTGRQRFPDSWSNEAERASAHQKTSDYVSELSSAVRLGFGDYVKETVT